MNYFKSLFKKKPDSVVQEKTEICFSDILEAYNSIKGKRKEEFPMPFWDVIALTTANQEQKQCIEQQIDSKLANKELPADIPYVVVCDPPGCRIGSGGSTFQILEELLDLFGERMFELKILLIHTGGKSQRLPSHSILGKLFAVFPSGDEISRLLDIKLALYHPFVAKMKPGIFVTASDDIETYWLDPKGEWSFENEGFTALAHPSPIPIALTHGVYVLPPGTKTSKSSFMTSCLRVLQKPTYEMMQECSAIYNSSDFSQSQNEFAYTDSAYYFTHSVSKVLLDALETLNPYQCELDAYGDLLQPLGSNSTKNYFTGQTKSALFKVQKNLYNLLKDIPLNLLLLNKSTFYHLGTMEEYVDNLTSNQNFIDETGLSNWSYSSLASLKENEVLSESIRGIVMHSVVRVESELGQSVVLECCDFETPVRMNRGIISHCRLKANNDIVDLPNDTLWHTASVIYHNCVKYVTVVFNLKDDIKEIKIKSECHKLKFLNKELNQVAELLSVKLPELLFDQDFSKMCIWNLQIFPIRSTREDSFNATLAMVNRLLKANDHDLTRSWLTTPRMSMDDIMDVKCVSDMLKYQKDLYAKIGRE